MHREPDQVELVAPAGGDGGAVVVVVAGAEEVGGEDAHRQVAAQRPRVRLGEHSGVALEDEDGLPEHREVGRPVRVGVGLPDEPGPGVGDAADEEGGHVEPLPGREVVTHEHGDLGVESVVGGHALNDRSVGSAGLVRS